MYLGLGIALVGFALALINFGLDEVTNPRLSVDRIWRRRLKDLGQTPSSLSAYVKLPKAKQSPIENVQVSLGGSDESKH